MYLAVPQMLHSCLVNLDIPKEKHDVYFLACHVIVWRTVYLAFANSGPDLSQCLPQRNVLRGHLSHRTIVWSANYLTLSVETVQSLVLQPLSYLSQKLKYSEKERWLRFFSASPSLSFSSLWLLKTGVDFVIFAQTTVLNTGSYKSDPKEPD
jgi:hypothetical protein